MSPDSFRYFLPLFITACCLCTLPVAAQQFHSSSNPVSVPFELHDNRIYLEVEINGQTGRFILDTGGYFGLDKEFAKSLNLKLSGRTLLGGAGANKVPVWYTRADTLQIGSLTVVDIRGPVVDFTPMKAALDLSYLDGIVGHELFRRYVVDVDYINNIVRFHHPEAFVPDPDWMNIPFSLYQGRLPLVRAEIDSRTGNFIIDTGDRSELTLFRNFSDLHMFHERYKLSDTLVTGYGIGGPVWAQTSAAERIQLGKAVYDSVIFRIPTLTTGAFANHSYAGSIGNGLMRQNNRMVFDYSRKILYLQ